MIPPINDTDALRAFIERPERAGLWGQPYTITPRLIVARFGDGQRLLCVTPLATRPNYFVVRVDSSPFEVLDVIDAIMDAAEDQFGRYDYDDDDRWFPVADWDIGVTWGAPIAIADWRHQRQQSGRDRTRRRWRKRGRR